MARFILCAVLTASGFGGAASAGDPGYKKVVYFETVTRTEVRELPYLKKVVRYDECGKPYAAYKACVREVEVEVTRRVPVVKYVKACD